MGCQIEMYVVEKHGFVAQLVEQETLNLLVEGSNPSEPTMFKNAICSTKKI